jgi:hypothetical protein
MLVAVAAVCITPKPLAGLEEMEAAVLAVMVLSQAAMELQIQAEAAAAETVQLAATEVWVLLS